MASSLVFDDKTTAVPVLTKGPPYFDRKIELLFGKPGTKVKLHTDLRIAFKFKKTSDSAPNQGQIKVYNLSEDSRVLAESKGSSLLLRAGYGENVEQIFVGNIHHTITELENADYVTTFEFGDGQTAYRESKTSTSFAKNSDIKDVITTVANNLGKTVTGLENIKSFKYIHGLTLSGSTREQMDMLCKKQNLEWSIQDDVVQIVQLGGTTTERAILISPETGLVGIPKKNKEGKIEIVSLLQPKLKPGRAIRLESKVMPFGNFRVDTVESTGDNFAKDWFSKIEAVKR